MVKWSLNLVIYFLVIYFHETKATQRPIIGVMAAESVDYKKQFHNHPYIAASYVKMIESVGAQVVPIPLKRPRAEYEKILSEINGLVLPGGSWKTVFNDSGPYYSTAKILYETSIKMNKKIHFPILGVCLGFEALLHLSNDDDDVRSLCRIHYELLPLQFLPGYRHSVLFETAPPKVIHALHSDITVNNHDWCINLKDIKGTKIDCEWKILATSRFEAGERFLAVVEHKRYPFFGIQFHPEKNPYEWNDRGASTYPRSLNALNALRYFYNRLVEEARKNHNSFPSLADEQNALIYNYAPIFSGNKTYNTSFTQVYLVK